MRKVSGPILIDQTQSTGGHKDDRTFPMFLTMSALVADFEYPTLPKSIEVGSRLILGGVSSSSIYKTFR